MNLVEVIKPTPEVIRLFQDPHVRPGNFVQSLLNSLGQEKASNFTNVNAYLESSLGDAFQTLEDLNTFQLDIEESKGRFINQEVQDGYDYLKSKAQFCQIELHRAKIKLNDLKIALCRFIILYESPNKTAVRQYHSVEEWMDAAALAEMRLTRSLSDGVDRNLQKLLALFMTFRSIVCSYDGPSMYIRQIENSFASLDALYEKVHLEMEVLNAKRTLVETRQELSTAKINLSSLQEEFKEKWAKDQKLAKLMSLQEKSSFTQVLTLISALLMLMGALGYFFMYHLQPGAAKSVDALSQRACLEIARKLEKSPRYQSQVLIFRKYAQNIYFRANSQTCEKLHRLDSAQIFSLGELLKADYSAGNQAVASYNGNRVLQVKGVGQNKLVVKLLNKTSGNIPFKIKVLEEANALRATLESDKQGLADDLLIVDLNARRASAE